MKKVWTCFFAILMVVLILAIIKTYAIYVDEYRNTAKFEVAKWVIVVNNKDITLEKNKDFTIDKYTYTQMDGVELDAANNKFAPGMVAEFELEIDSKEVDVAFDYFLDIDMSHVNNDNIKIAYVKNSLNNIDFVEDKYHGYFDLNSVEKNRKDIITVGLEWLDNEGTEDYEFIKDKDDKLIIPISINLKQRTENY